MSYKLKTKIVIGTEKPVIRRTIVDAGKYEVQVVRIEKRPEPGKGKITGTLHDIILRIDDGEYEGVEIPVFCPFACIEKKYRTWGEQTLASIAWAVSVGELDDLTQLLGKPFLVQVVVAEEEFTDRTSGERRTAKQNKVVDFDRVELTKKYVIDSWDDDED